MAKSEENLHSQKHEKKLTRIPSLKNVTGIKIPLFSKKKKVIPTTTPLNPSVDGIIREEDQESSSEIEMSSPVIVPKVVNPLLINNEDNDNCKKKEISEDSELDSSTFAKYFNLPDERVIDNFICTLIKKGMLLIQGILYITQNYVCFRSQIVSKKTTIIPFKDIICIRKSCLLKSIPNCIEIHTTKKKYTWTSLLHRTEAFELMDTRWRNIRKKSGMPIIDNINSNHSNNDFWEQNFNELAEDIINSDVLISESCIHESEKPKNIPSRYTEIFPLSVGEFFNRYISNRSVPFWVEFIKQDGYPLSSCTKWVKTKSNCCYERKMEFKTPIKLAYSPSSHTRVVQIQRYRFISINEIIFETSSYSKDVPLSTQFFVESRWNIKKLENDNTCELNISIGVRFKKKTFFKKVIEQTAIEGSRGWFKNWIHFAISLTGNYNKKRECKGDEEEELDVKRILSNPLLIKDKVEEEPISKAKSLPIIMLFLILMIFGKLKKYALLVFIILLFGISFYLYADNLIKYNEIDNIREEISFITKESNELKELTENLHPNIHIITNQLKDKIDYIPFQNNQDAIIDFTNKLKTEL